MTAGPASGGGSAGGGRRLRLASANLLSGRELTTGTADPKLLQLALGALDADLLAVQEVDRGLPRSRGVDQVALAAQALGAPEHRFVRVLAGTPGTPEARPTRAGEPELPGAAGYGIGLVSRLPVESWHELRLGAAPGRYPLAVQVQPLRFRWLPDEPRAAVAAVLVEPRLTVVCTHLSFVTGVNVHQLRRIRRWLAALPAPRILLGDLNLPGRLPGLVTGWTPLVEGPTFPSPQPRLQLDHILADGLPPGAASGGRVVPLPVSDHRAVTVDLVL